MATHVALLRGINVGGNNKVPMADLRALVADLGHTDVSTYIQSGNVLFTALASAECADVARAITAAIAERLGVTAPVVVVTREELGQIHAANPFPDEPDPKRVHAVVLSEPPGPELTAKLEAAMAQSASNPAVNSTFPLWMYVDTPVCPSSVTSARRSVIATLFLPPRLIPRSNATCVAMDLFFPAGAPAAQVLARDLITANGRPPR